MTTTKTPATNIVYFDSDPTSLGTGFIKLIGLKTTFSNGDLKKSFLFKKFKINCSFLQFVRFRRRLYSNRND